MADTRRGDPEIRRRAAWLLGMLALVAALIVVISVVFFNGGGSDGPDENAGPTVFPSSSNSASSRPDTSSSGSSSDSSGSPSDVDSSQSPSGSGTGSSPAPGGKPKCPSDETCALDSDVGNAIAAVNAYRAQNDKNPVDGTVSDDARQCALSKGDDCSGGWAQTQVPVKDKRVDGAAAIDKLPSRDRLLNDMKSFEVGWAYDPGSKTAYLAVIRQGG